MAAGEVVIDDDFCAKLTAPSNSKSARTSSVSRMMNSLLFFLRLFAWIPRPRMKLVAAPTCDGFKFEIDALACRALRAGGHVRS
jgi:hypothetical protein